MYSLEKLTVSVTGHEASDLYNRYYRNQFDEFMDRYSGLSSLRDYGSQSIEDMGSGWSMPDPTFLKRNGVDIKY